MLRNVRASSSYAPFGAPWNFAGWPALVLPAGRHAKTGMPLSVQLVAPPGQEARLLAVAAQLEQRAPWQPVAPPSPDRPSAGPAGGPSGPAAPAARGRQTRSTCGPSSA